jgi:RND superfamily putative drug exporter
VLVPIFRSLLLPAIALVLNVVTILAAFGVLALAFQGDNALGGPGYLDAIIAMGVVGIVFGLSIDYAVFLVSRMREGYALTGSTNAAIEYGLRGTARIVTGAALIMSAAFVSLAVSGMSTLRQFGVGLTVAVLLDATIVRLVLLPALIKLAGPAAWWVPGWLDRLLPGSSSFARERPADGAAPRPYPAAAGPA